MGRKDATHRVHFLTCSCQLCHFGNVAVYSKVEQHIGESESLLTFLLTCLCARPSGVTGYAFLGLGSVHHTARGATRKPRRAVEQAWGRRWQWQWKVG